MATAASIFDSSIANFRLIEAGKTDPKGLAIDVHIISPGWGSSGYYPEKVLRKACENGVYPVGMHMHIDHPTRTAEKEQPARTIKGESPLAAILTEAGHYDSKGWDGPGVYARARVLPQFVQDIRAMDGHIGISHYVSGVSESGEAEGKKGPIIRELLPDALNTVDFVTVPGAGGHYRTLFSEMKVRQVTEDPTENNGITEAENLVGKVQESTNKKKEGKMAESKQESITLSEVRTNHPEIFEEMKKTISEELKIEMVTKDQTKKLDEAATTIKAKEQEITELKRKLGERAAREFVATEITKAKIPEASGKVLAEALIKQVVYVEDGSIDAAKFGEIVTREIKAKQEELAAVRKEMGITGNGAGAPPATGTTLKESFKDTYLRQGMTPEKAEQMAALAAAGR